VSLNLVHEILLGIGKQMIVKSAELSMNGFGHRKRRIFKSSERSMIGRPLSLIECVFLLLSSGPISTSSVCNYHFEGHMNINNNMWNGQMQGQSEPPPTNAPYKRDVHRYETLIHFAPLP
jgi:hypothetical protein